MILKDSIFSSKIEYFTTLYRTLNYAKAARVIPMSYQGLKKAIRTLESDLSVELFEESLGSRLLPTTYATMLYEQIRSWIQDSRNLEYTFAGLRADERKVIAVAASEGSLGLLGNDLSDRFMQTYPSLMLEIYEYPDFVVDRVLADGEIDLAITVAPFDQAFETTSLTNAQYVVWISKEHRLSNRTLISLNDLEGEVVMTYDLHVKNSGQFRASLREMGVHPDSIQTCSEIIWILTFALENRGIGIGIDYLGKQLSRHTSLVSIPFRESLAWSLGISHRKGHILSDDEKTAIGFFKDRARKQADSLQFEILESEF